MFISQAESAAKGFKKWSLAHKAPRNDVDQAGEATPTEATPTEAAPLSPALVSSSEQTK